MRAAPMRGEDEAQIASPVSGQPVSNSRAACDKPATPPVLDLPTLPEYSLRHPYSQAVDE